MSEPFTKITNNIYLGSVANIKDESIQNINIDLILNFAEECVYESEIEQKHFNFLDNSEQNIINYFDYVSDIFSQYIHNNKIIFVHCFAGKSRSASFVIAYLVKKCNMTLQNAFEFVKEKRYIYPNISFIDQLMEYEMRIKKLQKSTFDYDNYVVNYTTEVCCIKKETVLEIYLLSNKNINDMLKKLNTPNKSKV